MKVVFPEPAMPTQTMDTGAELEGVDSAMVNLLFAATRRVERVCRLQLAKESRESRESDKVGQGAVECLGRISLAGTFGGDVKAAIAAAVPR